MTRRIPVRELYRQVFEHARIQDDPEFDVEASLARFMVRMREALSGPRHCPGCRGYTEGWAGECPGIADDRDGPA